MSASVQELFNVSDQLAKNLEISHKLAVPKISKIVINAGIGAIKEDNKAIEKIKKDLSLITGQSPVGSANAGTQSTNVGAPIMELILEGLCANRSTHRLLALFGLRAGERNTADLSRSITVLACERATGTSTRFWLNADNR